MNVKVKVLSAGLLAASVATSVDCIQPSRNAFSGQSHRLGDDAPPPAPQPYEGQPPPGYQRGAYGAPFNYRPRTFETPTNPRVHHAPPPASQLYEGPPPTGYSSDESEQQSPGSQGSEIVVEDPEQPHDHPGEAERQRPQGDEVAVEDPVQTLNNIATLALMRTDLEIIGGWAYEIAELRQMRAAIEMQATQQRLRLDILGVNLDQEMGTLILTIYTVAPQQAAAIILQLAHVLDGNNTREVVTMAARMRAIVLDNGREVPIILHILTRDARLRQQSEQLLRNLGGIPGRVDVGVGTLPDRADATVDASGPPEVVPQGEITRAAQVMYPMMGPEPCAYALARALARTPGIWVDDLAHEVLAYMEQYTSPQDLQYIRQRAGEHNRNVEDRDRRMRIRYLGDYADADSEHQAAPLAPGAPSSPEDEESPEEQQTNLGNLETPEAETEATPVLHEPLADEPVPEGENQRNMEIVGARVIGGWMELVRKAYTSAKGDAEKEAAKCNQLIQAIAKLIERSDDSNLSGVINMMISLRAHASGACDLLGGRQCAVETRGRLLRRGIPVPGIIDEIIAYRAE